MQDEIQNTDASRGAENAGSMENSKK